MTIRIIPALPAILLPGILLLAACGGEPEGESESGGEAAGEVLGGTISDDMIALDQLTSQSPPEVSQPGSGVSASAQEASDQDESEEQSRPEPEAAPEGASAEEG